MSSSSGGILNCVFFCFFLERTTGTTVVSVKISLGSDNNLALKNYKVFFFSALDLRALTRCLALLKKVLFFFPFWRNLQQ
jgi:hypothetical protein